MNDAPLFQNTDEQERVYAPQQLPAGSDAGVQIEGSDTTNDTSSVGPREGAPVANVGTASTGFSAPPGEVGKDEAPDAPRGRQ